MSKEKVHIDQYFKEKIETQEVEGDIPSFDSFLTNSGTSLSSVEVTKGTVSVFSKTMLFLVPAVVVTLGSLWYANLKEDNKELEQKTKVFKRESIELEVVNVVEETEKENTSVGLKPTVRDESVKEKKNVILAPEETPKIEILKEESIVVLPDSKELEIIEEPLSEEMIVDSNVVLEQEIIEEDVKPLNGLDLFMEKHLDENEKGVDLYKEK